MPAQGREAAVDLAPPTFREDTVGVAQRDRLGGPQRRIVEAAEERFHVLAARALPPDGFKEPGGLGGVGDRAAVNGPADIGGFPLDLAEGLAGSSRRSTA